MVSQQLPLLTGSDDGHGNGNGNGHVGGHRAQTRLAWHDVLDVQAMPVRPRSLSGSLRGMTLAFDVAALVVGTQVLATTGLAGLGYSGLVVGVAAVSGGYRLRIAPRLGNDFWRIVFWTLLPVPVVALGVAPARTVELAEGLVGVAVLMLVARRLSYASVRMARRRGWAVEPTLIVGAGELAATIANTLYARPEYGLRPVGFVDGTPAQPMPPNLGNLDDLPRILDEFAVRRVIVAYGPSREVELVPILRACIRRNVDVYVAPRFFELGAQPMGADWEDLWGIPIRRLNGFAFHRGAAGFKRVFDVVVAGLALLVTLPLIALAAAAVRISIGRPILFRQKRVGQHGKPIEVLKFRTMPALGAPDTTWSVDAAREVGRVGRFLRRTSIDELPQFWNVLRGDMSVVGPRPERPYFYEQFRASIPRYEDRQRLPVGITGWAQVHGLRGDTSIEQRARFDNYYVEHWSPWLDLVICARTTASLFRNHD